MKRNRKILFVATGFIVSFIVWTLLVSTVDVMQVGQNGTNIGFASFNSFVHRLTGVHMYLYTLTDILGFVPIGFALFFAVLGLCQLTARKSLLKVDRDILILGTFYAAVISVFVFFEIFVINYRPILIDGRLEASYPSSTTLLTMCVIPTAVMMLSRRIKNTPLRRIISVALWTFTVFMVISRLISGVHWATDIIGGALISTGLVLLFGYFTETHE